MGEISAVKRGAVAHAFATLVDGAMFGQLKPGERSAAFRAAFAFHKTGVQLRELQPSLERFAAKLGIDLNGRAVDDSVADLLDAIRQARTALAS